MNILITDDEYLARERLKRLLEQTGEQHSIFEAETGIDAIKQCAQHSIDLIFLDIRMPEMDGLEAAWHLSRTEAPPAIIFITAYDEYALQAFKVNAIDYLLKPVKQEQLGAAIKKAGKLNQLQLAKMHDQAPQLPQRQHISARVRGEVQLIPLQDIIYFQADQKYVNVRHRSGEVLIEEPLKQLEQDFPEQFVRIHRNALINQKYINGLSKDEHGHLFVTLKHCDSQLEVSRRHAAEIRKLVKSL
ncbi:LytR/AlgR family response regulator transcription factor [Pleionea litopenaei]|uniref:LytTR family DNA-binding domain-containing protein n=1 Tax=Pleionea litopenaei TaxID=3070815 RepID=A0AA51RR79_9GAMM|nr:LytTR family DNA-binding domain-containing protein [Pleionea sp. HL-JVS1]WMS86136.1 LytTR family DNA-binding domain-containing protein [Pleionea sp. HL-JVS1]